MPRSRKLRKTRKTRKQRKQRGSGIGFSKPPPPAPPAPPLSLFDLIGSDNENEQEKSEEIRAAIEGVDVNEKDENGLTPLIALIIETNIDDESAEWYENIIHHLIGNDIDYMAADGSALHYAAKLGQFDYVHYLINEGANINLQNARGETPVFLASTKSHFNIVQALGARRANVNIPDAQGRRPIQVIGIDRGPVNAPVNAPEFFNEPTMEALCQYGAIGPECNQILIRLAQEEALALALEAEHLTLTLDVPNQGIKEIPSDQMTNMVSHDNFVDGEEIIVITENNHNFIYKIGPLQKWFSTKIRSGHDIPNPATNNPITNQNQISKWTARVPKKLNNSKKKKL